MARYAVEQYGNKEMFGIHLDVAVPKMDWIQESSKDGKKLKEILEKINGVEEVTSYGQRLSIKRGGVFTVAELLPEILAVLKEELKIDDDLIEVEAYT